MEKRTRKIKEEITKYAGKRIAGVVPAIAIDNRRELNPNGWEWLGELYTVVFERISQRRAPSFLMATSNGEKRKRACFF